MAFTKHASIELLSRGLILVSSRLRLHGRFGRLSFGHINEQVRDLFRPIENPRERSHDRKARDAYLPHPEHEKVKQMLLRLVEDVVVVDYEM